MFGRLSRKSQSKESVSTPSKDAQDLLRKIEESLQAARTESSFPQVNEARRLAKELETLVNRIKGGDEQSLWSSQLGKRIWRDSFATLCLTFVCFICFLFSKPS